MRALVYVEVGKMRIEQRPRSAPAAGEMEIAVETAGICGADISGFLGRSRRRKPPLILGHELAGRTSTGERVVVDPLIPCGRCVECLAGATNLCPNLRLLGMDSTQGCFAEFVSVPQCQVHGISSELADAQAVLVEPLANVVHLFRRALPEPPFRMGIIGSGLMGSLALRMAPLAGASEVLVEDVDETRLAAARRGGATWAVHAETGQNEARDFSGHGLDLVLDACGSERARQEAFDLCRPGGTVVLLGMAAERSTMDFGAAIRKEQTALMSFGYTPSDFKRSLKLIVGGTIDLRHCTAEMPLEEGQKAFEKMSTSRGDTLKMLLRVR